jgi:hypothetical protein
MFVKNLASIYFSGDSVLAAELDSSRKKVKKVASIDLPNGVSSVKKVSDTKKLTELLRELWTKNSFKSKDVGIIIPEFSTFTKLISLPKLTASEIGEAVNWQAQEYLPTGVENMVLDWKILEKGSTNTEVLMVAIPKLILMDYVDACVNAGLFPVSVETPSISIGNVIKTTEGFIVVFVEKGQTLIVSGEKNKIYGTSIIDENDTTGISLSVSKIIKHFNKVEFKNIFVGGPGMTGVIIDQLKNSYKVNISVLNPEVFGDPGEIQKYLVPISLLRSPIAEPSDPNTLNLLPGNLVGKYQSQKLRTQIWSLTLTVTVFVWISLLVVLGSFMVLSRQIAVLKSQSQKTLEIAVTRKKAETEATAINKIADDVLAIKKATVYPEVLLNYIFNAKPSGVNIDSYDMDLDKGVTVLRGVSVDRQSLVNFKENLGKVSDFDSVNIPISSFEEVNNLIFSISFNYKPLNRKSQIKKQ